LLAYLPSKVEKLLVGVQLTGVRLQVAPRLNGHLAAAPGNIGSFWVCGFSH